MKNYLDLVPISAKVHRKQNRMSIICIVLAVFLVTFRAAAPFDALDDDAIIEL